MQKDYATKDRALLIMGRERVTTSTGATIERGLTQESDALAEKRAAALVALGDKYLCAKVNELQNNMRPPFGVEFRERQQMRKLLARRGLKIKHKLFECSPNCKNDYCQFHMGGLAYCTVCNGFEGSLTTECCGYSLTQKQQQKIYQHGYDFNKGQWTPKEPTP